MMRTIPAAAPSSSLLIMVWPKRDSAALTHSATYRAGV